jgi:branched-chain amino acid transport system ATP-binding protein
MLEASHLSVRFGGLQALADVNLSVDARQIVALIGPNGAGKSTLFNIVSGFVKPDAGSVLFDGRDITGLPPHEICRRGLARTFQIVQPFAAQTVRDNVAVGAHLHLRARRDALARAEEVAARVGLAAELDKPASSLTVAARKRLELARALATAPKLLLLDEVLAGLNPAEIAGILPVISDLRNSGITVLMVEHVMQAVMNLADHVYVLNNGQLIAAGAPNEIANNRDVIEAYLGHGTAARLRARAGRPYA